MAVVSPPFSDSLRILPPTVTETSWIGFEYVTYRIAIESLSGSSPFITSADWRNSVDTYTTYTIAPDSINNSAIAVTETSWVDYTYITYLNYAVESLNNSAFAVKDTSWT